MMDVRVGRMFSLIKIVLVCSFVGLSIFTFKNWRKYCVYPRKEIPNLENRKMSKSPSPEPSITKSPSPEPSITKSPPITNGPIPEHLITNSPSKKSGIIKSPNLIEFVVLGNPSSFDLDEFEIVYADSGDTWYVSV